MREIRPSGSEGGGTEFNRFSLPLSTAGRAQQRWAGPNTVRPYQSGSFAAALQGAAHILSSESGARQGGRAYSHPEAYGFDTLNRLTSAVATGNSTYNLSFVYNEDETVSGNGVRP